MTELEFFLLALSISLVVAGFIINVILSAQLKQKRKDGNKLAEKLYDCQEDKKRIKQEYESKISRLINAPHRNETKLSSHDRGFLNTLISRRLNTIDKEIKRYEGISIANFRDIGNLNNVQEKIELLKSERKQLNEFQEKHIAIYFDSKWVTDGGENK